MKKMLIFMLAIIIIVISIIVVKYYSYRADYNIAMQENSEYEQYIDKKEITGLDVASLINKSVDKNIRNKIEKDDKGIFTQNDENSIKIEVYMTDTETTYQMETIYNQGTEQFVQYCGNVNFKCSKIEYHDKTKKIKYILFEQI